MKIFWLCLSFCFAALPQGMAQSYPELVKALHAEEKAEPQTPSGPSAQQLQVRRAWQKGKLLDDYLLEHEERASEILTRLAADLKADRSHIYYQLQFARTYPDAPPPLDLHWGFYQYLLAVNDARERNALAERAFREKWNWDKLRAEVKAANRSNKEFVFTAEPGKTGVYRVMKAKRGPYRGEKVLDLGFGNYYKPSRLEASEYQMIRASCRPAEKGAPRSCTFSAAPGSEKDLFTYEAEVFKVIDGDTFQAVADLGFGMTTVQDFRLWGLDAPEINTKKGREAKKALEEFLLPRPVVIRALRMDKYGRFLADVWQVSAAPQKKPLYINEALAARGLAQSAPRE